MSLDREAALQKHSCRRCFERKVKCDKKQPCTHCSKHSIECDYRSRPTVARALKQLNSSSAQKTRQQRSDSLLSQSGTTNAVDHEGRPLHFFTDSEQIQSARRRSGDRICERVAETFETITHNTEQSDSEHEEICTDPSIAFLFGLDSQQRTPEHPPSHIAHRLWTIYKYNIEPLVKILHVPSMDIQVKEFLDGGLANTVELNVFLFASYAAAVHSLTEERFREILPGRKSQTLSKYRSATMTCLIQAKFLATNSLMILQAYCIFLIAVRDMYDGRTIWVMTGTAVRIAQAMRLHIDGSHRGLSPFETEIQRRIWSYLIATDSRTAEGAGTEKFALFNDRPDGTMKPTNANDCELSPRMSEAPVDSEKITDASFCTLRAELGSFLRLHIFEGSQTQRSIDKDAMQAHSYIDELLENLEGNLRDKYTKHCTPTIPYQCMIAVISTHSIDNIRFMLHHPKRWPDSDAIPTDERNLLWSTSLSLLKGFVACRLNPLLSGYRWHMNYSFPWQPMIHLLDCLHHSKQLSEENDDAWRLVSDIYLTHPHFLTQKKRPIHHAIGKSVLEAFQMRQRLLNDQGLHAMEVPNFIRTIQATQVDRHKRLRLQTNQDSCTKTDPTPLFTPQISSFTSASAQRSPDDWTDVNWEEWGQLLDDWEKNLDSLSQ